MQYFKRSPTVDGVEFTQLFIFKPFVVKFVGSDKESKFDVRVFTLIKRKDKLTSSAVVLLEIGIVANSLQGP